MTKPAVLVIGAGAVGLPLGYHLQLAGAAVTFVVRSGRKTAFEGPTQLYSYDDAELKTFDGYRVVDDVSKLAQQTFQFVVVTLDGYASRGTEGIAVLGAVGDMIRSTDATVVVLGMGIGLRRHYLETMGIADGRLLRGLFGMLSHQPTTQVPMPAGTDPAQVAKASVCYRQSPKQLGLRVDTTNSIAAKRFAELYNRSGLSRCSLMNPKLVDTIADAVFPIYAACEIAGWPGIDAVVADKSLWRLACRAQGEILALPHNGWFGKAMAIVVGTHVTAAIHRKTERDMRPLDSAAFNRFHHGGKVRSQNIEVLRNGFAVGRRHGRPMAALDTLLTRLESLDATEQSAHTK